MTCLAPCAEEILAVDLLDGGAFTEVYTGDDPERRELVPWWRPQPAAQALAVQQHDGARWLVTPASRGASQPLAAYAPLLASGNEPGLLIRGRVRGRGVVTVVDGTGAEARFSVAGALGSEAQSGGAVFEIDGSSLVAAFGAPPTPRLEIRLAGDGQPAYWTALEAHVPLPAPSAAELRAEIIARIDEISAVWFERGLDPETGMLAGYHDAVTGERLGALEGGVHPLWEALLEALRHEDRAAWRGPFEVFLEAYLEHGFHEPTGLPARWNFASGAPDLDKHIEIHVDLRFLLNVWEHGPERFRERAFERALAMAETVLARGVLPDGQVAAAYRPRNAEPTTVVNPLRQFDVPAQLARLAAATGDERFAEAARNAVAAWEYAHRWPGSWDIIDNGFDDEFGMYAGDAVTMLAALPTEVAFRTLVRSGWDYYAPLWQDALRFGGAIATDQVRCWKLLLEFAELEPEVADDIRARIPHAIRTHFKGEQYGNGAWGDFSFEHFDPRTGIQVGDLPGAPAILLQGIALAYRPEIAAGFGGGLAEVRALYATLLFSSVEHYRRPHGYLLLPESAGVNSAGGGLRLLTGLAEMLGRL